LLLTTVCAAFFAGLAVWTTRPATISLEVTSKGTVIFAGKETTPAGLKPLLVRKRQVIDATPLHSAPQTTVVIRADRNAQAGTVQEAIEVCGEVGFEKFTLRAAEGATVEQ
jgi:biopolymer transport protein ExbD